MFVSASDTSFSHKSYIFGHLAFLIHLCHGVGMWGYIYMHFYEGFHTEKHLPQERKISKFMACAFFYTYRLLAIYLFVKVRGCCLHYTHHRLSLKRGKTLLLLLNRFSCVRLCATP